MKAWTPQNVITTAIAIIIAYFFVKFVFYKVETNEEIGRINRVIEDAKKAYMPHVMIDH